MHTESQPVCHNPRATGERTSHSAHRQLQAADSQQTHRRSARLQRRQPYHLLRFSGRQGFLCVQMLTHATTRLIVASRILAILASRLACMVAARPLLLLLMLRMLDLKPALVRACSGAGSRM